MKIMITIINIISAIPILIYPFILIAGVMSFDAPESGKSLVAWFVFVASIGYPLLIIAFIFLSQRYNSTSLALIALIPLLVLVYALSISGGTTQKNNFSTLNKDFVCDSNSFLSIGGNETDPIRGLRFLEKRNFFTYKNNDIASIYGNKWINVQKINSKDIKDRIDQLLNYCKNTEGKTPFQVYLKIEDSQIKEFLRQI
jgi:hypothetical protein